MPEKRRRERQAEVMAALGVIKPAFCFLVLFLFIYFYYFLMRRTQAVNDAEGSERPPCDQSTEWCDDGDATQLQQNEQMTNEDFVL